MVDLTNKYRPHSFDDVLEQVPASAWLRKQAFTGKGNSVVLHGPFGVGKTSLARIYAQALQCEKVGETGSQCRVCEQCRFFESPEGRHPDVPELNGALSGRLEDVEGLLKSLRHRPMVGRRRILILDEAHQVSPKAFDAMLKMLEEPPKWVTIIILTSEIEKIKAAVTSRCTEYELKPISFNNIVARLKEICEWERIFHDVSGLSLIAQISCGNVRAAIKRLEQIADNDSTVTEPEVRAFFKLDFVDLLVRWMRAALAADLQRQIEVIDGWSDVASKKAEALEAFLTFMFTTDIRRIYRQDLVMQSLRIDDREFIVSEMATRAAAANIDENKFWQEAVEFWGPRAGGVTEATLIAKVIRFNDWLNIDRATVTVGSGFSGMRLKSPPHNLMLPSLSFEAISEAATFPQTVRSES